MTTPQPFDANSEAKKLYQLSKSPDHSAFQKEMDEIKKDPAHYNATLKAIATQEKQREAQTVQNRENMSPGSKLHELQIVHDGSGAVKEINSKEVPVEKIGQEGNLPKVVLYQPHSGGEAGKPPVQNQEAARQEAARQEAARQEAARQEAARQEAARQAQRVQTEAYGLLSKLSDHNGPGFAKEYNNLPDSEKAAVGQAMQQQNHDPSLRILQNPDGSIKSIMKNGHLEYVAPGEFLNEAYDKKSHPALAEYYKNLSPEDKKAFAQTLQAQAGLHNVHVQLDDQGNLKEVDDANGKKIYPDGKFGAIIHKAEKTVVDVQIRH